MEVTKRFKGLDLTDRLPEELLMEVCNKVQEVATTEKEVQEGKLVEVL